MFTSYYPSVLRLLFLFTWRTTWPVCFLHYLWVFVPLFDCWHGWKQAMDGGGVVSDVMCVSPEVLSHMITQQCLFVIKTTIQIYKKSDYTRDYTINSVKKQCTTPCVEGCELLMFSLFVFIPSETLAKSTNLKIFTITTEPFYFLSDIFKYAPFNIVIGCFLSTCWNIMLLRAFGKNEWFFKPFWNNITKQLKIKCNSHRSIQ